LKKVLFKGEKKRPSREEAEISNCIAGGITLDVVLVSLVHEMGLSSDYTEKWSFGGEKKRTYGLKGSSLDHVG